MKPTVTWSNIKTALFFLVHLPLLSIRGGCRILVKDLVIANACRIENRCQYCTRLPEWTQRDSSSPLLMELLCLSDCQWRLPTVSQYTIQLWFHYSFIPLLSSLEFLLRVGGPQLRVAARVYGSGYEYDLTPLLKHLRSKQRRVKGCSTSGC